MTIAERLDEAIRLNDLLNDRNVALEQTLDDMEEELMKVKVQRSALRSEKDSMERENRTLQGLIAEYSKVVPMKAVEESPTGLQIQALQVRLAHLQNSHNAALEALLDLSLYAKELESQFTRFRTASKGGGEGEGEGDPSSLSSPPAPPITTPDKSLSTRSAVVVPRISDMSVDTMRYSEEITGTKQVVLNKWY